MVEFGISTGAFDFSLQVSSLARAVEERGFDTLAFGEHTHIPIDAPSPVPPEMVRRFASQFDPYVCIATGAAVTTRLRLGTCVTLIPEHHPIALAKTIASLDQGSAGRLFFGIGAGWNKEVENHGVAMADRWKVTREHVLAMRAIWRSEEAEFHGKFVDFGPMWSFPKPIRPEGPPILMGASSQWSFDRIVEYCDGWMPQDDGDVIERGLTELRGAAERAGKPFADFLVMPFVPAPSRERLEQLVELGVTGVQLWLRAAKPDDQLAALDEFAELVKPFRTA